jgi:hypothetical protein
MKSKQTGFLKIYICFIFIYCSSTAIIYGSPSILPEYLDIQVNTVDFSNMLIMCLYLGISIVWILEFGKLLENCYPIEYIIYAISAIGRMISMLMDGFPTGGYIFELLQSLYSDRTQFSIKNTVRTNKIVKSQHLQLVSNGWALGSI